MKTQEKDMDLLHDAGAAPALEDEKDLIKNAAANENSEKEPTEEEAKSYEIVGVRFKPSGKSYYFDPCGAKPKNGDSVIVETSRGLELGTVSIENKTVSAKEVVLPLKKMLRIATKNDLKKHEETKALEEKAKKIWLQKMETSDLEMALSDVECTFDHSKLIFYFTAEGRVDFREFVKDLASVFKMRIELRQIGVRDEAKKLGGLGICGRPLCCSAFLDDFQQVSIKMAKEQNLSLNSAKISGTCGRLMCCLRYENEVYQEAAKRCPKQDSLVQTPDGKGNVIEVNVLCGKCRVRLQESADHTTTVYDAKDLTVLPKPKPVKKSEKNSKKIEK